MTCAFVCNLTVGARSFAGNPYDGHTLHEQIERSAILIQGLDVKPDKVYTDPRGS